MPIKLDPTKLNLEANQIQQMLAEKGYRYVCGVDEVGRGPLAGPVVAAAVILPLDNPIEGIDDSIEGIDDSLEGVDDSIEGIDDSKKLTALRREKLFEQIVNSRAVCSVGIIDNDGIDNLNILKASLMAMRKAIMDLKRAPEIVLVDGTFPVPKIDYPQFAIVGGDRHCKSIAAASIVAKVTRDRIMDRYQALYPSFSFSKHKGYPTPEHLKELQRHGPCEIHRKTFKPVAELSDKYVLL